MKSKQEVIRLMAPFSMRCNSCGEYIYAGKKFNGRKETVNGEEYYGIKIFRFYIKCPMCSSEITFKTDPRNADYTAEHGITRNFEPWREGREEDANADPLAHIMEEEGLEGSDEEDPMKALEKRQDEAKREMEIMDALQDIRTRNARFDRVDTDDVLLSLQEKGKAKLSAEQIEQQKFEEEDEELVRRYFGKDQAVIDKPASRTNSASSPSPPTPAEGTTPDTQQTPHKSVKRLHPELDERSMGVGISDKEPDVKALLSMQTKEQLQGNGKPGGLPNPAKRKKGTSAFGIVRKKT